jgi:hypothetical protein
MPANPKVQKREKERARQDKQREKEERRRQRRVDRNERAADPTPRDEMADIVPGPASEGSQGSEG